MNGIGTGQAGAMVVITCLIVLYVGSLIFHTIKRPNLGGLMQLVILLAVMWVGWNLRTWPTRAKGDPMLWVFLLAWRDSALTLLYVLADSFGLDDLWRRIIEIGGA